MNRRILMSVAALAASSTFALAQGAGKPDAAGSQGAPPSASDVAPGQTKPAGESARGEAPGQIKQEGQSARDMAPGQTKEGPDARSNNQRKSDVNDRDSKDRKSAADKSDKDGGKNRAGANTGASSGESGSAKTDADRNARDGDRDSGATGKSAGEGGSSATDRKGSITEVTTEQKTKVRSAFTRHRVDPARINVSVNVGVAVPRDVRLYAIPEDIVVIVPAYREYRYFIVDDRVCIVDPDTYEIVDIIILV